MTYIFKDATFSCTSFCTPTRGALTAVAAGAGGVAVLCSCCAGNNGCEEPVGGPSPAELTDDSMPAARKEASNDGSGGPNPVAD